MFDLERYRKLMLETEMVEMRKASEKMLWDCAKLYCQIWREEPWNEEFWTPEVVIQDMRKEMARPCAEGYLAINIYNSQVIGFTWGYSVSQSEMQIISGNEKLNFLFSANNRVFYVDELGVAKEHRHHGIGNSLAANLLVAAMIRGINLIVLRTNKKAEAATSIYREIGFQNLLIEDQQHPDRTYWAFLK